MRRVVLIGAESSGKTTLAARLAAHYGTVWLPEYVRAFVDAKGAAPELADVPTIARGHLDAEARLAPRARRLLILDTDLVSTCVYSLYYFGTCPASVVAASFRHHADLYLFTDVDIPWEADPGQRDGPDVRAALHERFHRELLRRRLPFQTVTGSLEARLQTATRAIDALLRGAR